MSHESKRSTSDKRPRDETPVASVHSERLLDDPDAPAASSEHSQTFVWGAKREKLLAQGVDPLQLERESESRRAERLAELEKIKAMRVERDAQAEAWEREKRRLEMEHENWSYQEWLREEKQFHLKQARERADIRLREGRPKAIDILQKNLEVDTKYEFNMRPPYEIFTGLTVAQLEELEEDIEMYLELSPAEMAFWKALRLLCAAQIKLCSGKRSPPPKDVLDVFAGQSLAELVKLQGEIDQQMDQGEDPEYWASLSEQCQVEIARATLREIHAQRLQDRLALMEESTRAAEREQLALQIRQRMAEAAPGAAAPVGPAAGAAAQGSRAPAAAAAVKRRAKLVIEDIEEDEDDEAAVQAALQRDGEDAVDVNRIRELERERRVLDAMLADGEVDADEGMSMLQLEMQQADANEEGFADEVEQQGPAGGPAWKDRYVPRKPKYYNRVRTGYEWNKYNSTHYNSDNPPPKVVHGYRFNIFYNDLVDPSRAPTYRLEPIPGNTDWAVLRFTAGPPYLDIAFRVVNKTWELSHKRGYKSVFDRGVLRLYINFKRDRYRR